MKNNLDIAAEYFDKGFNCAQSVFATFCRKYNLEEEMALKISGGLGSGLRFGEVCGAVSGAILVIGLKYGHSHSDKLEEKMLCNTKTEEFINAFRKQNDSIICKEILGCDISTEEGRKQALKNNLFTTLCKEKVLNSVKLLEELGY